MKLKHYQGYGCVCAQKERDVRIETNYDGVVRKLTIRVLGNHECGLERTDDNYLVYNWLVKRFVRGYTEQDVLSYTAEDKYVHTPEGDCEVCTYTIYLKEKTK